MTMISKTNAWELWNSTINANYEFRVLQTRWAARVDFVKVFAVPLADLKRYIA